MGTRSGAMAQLVAHHTGSVGVRGSSPLSSTRATPGHIAWGFLLRGSSEWPNILTLSYRRCREHRRCSGQAVVGDPSIDGLSHALGVNRWLALDGRPLFKGNGWLLRGDQGGVALDDPRAPVAGLRYFRLVAGDPPGARPHSPLTSCESRRARRSQPGQPHGPRCASAPTIAWCAPAGARPRSGRRSPQRPRGRARCSSQPR
jgi:hypothetical protein